MVAVVIAVVIAVAAVIVVVIHEVTVVDAIVMIIVLVVDIAVVVVVVVIILVVHVTIKDMLRLGYCLFLTNEDYCTVVGCSESHICLVCGVVDCHGDCYLFRSS